MNNAQHWGWMIVVLVVFGCCTYLFTVNRPDVQKGGLHVEDHGWAVIEIGRGGCARLDPLKGDKNGHLGNKT